MISEYNVDAHKAKVVVQSKNGAQAAEALAALIDGSPILSRHYYMTFDVHTQEFWVIEKV